MATTKLSDTQLVILTTAAERNKARVLPVSNTLSTKGAALKRALNTLLKRDLLEEISAAAGDEEWRRDDEGRKLTLAITASGKAAVGLDVTEDAGDGSQSASGATRRKPQSRHRKSAPDGGCGDAKTASIFRPGTKGAALVDLLRRDKGATIGEMMTASGWQAHSVRGFLSGTVKKKHGLTMVSDKSGDEARRYRIA